MSRARPAIPALPLLGLAVQRVLAAPMAVLLELDPARVVPPVLLRCVVPALALGALQGHDRSYVLLRHTRLSRGRLSAGSATPGSP